MLSEKYRIIIKKIELNYQEFQHNFWLKYKIEYYTALILKTILMKHNLCVIKSTNLDDLVLWPGAATPQYSL